MEAFRVRGILMLAVPWLAIYVVDVALRWRLSVSVSAGQVQWYTTRMNRVFAYFGRQHPRFVALWFTVGAVLGVVAMVLAVAVLGYTIVSQLVFPPDQQVLTAVIPGVNLPMTEAGYYFFALVVAGILHEVGHGIAAVSERVQVHGFGVFLIGVYPGAFVDLNSDQLAALPPGRQLRVYCAGVWHNFMLSLVCLLLVYAMPTLVWPLYGTTTAGATVHYVAPGSAVSGSIESGALIVGINECPVTSAADWSTCLQAIMHQEIGTNPGFCTPEAFVEEIPQSLYICCEPNLDTATLPEEVARTALCFSHAWQPDQAGDAAAGGPADLALQARDDATTAQRGSRLYCLPARQVVAHATCEEDNDCRERPTNGPEQSSDAELESSPTPMCLRPAAAELSERLIRIRVAGQPTVLYVGHPVNLLTTVAVQDLRPRVSWLPVYLPLVLDRLLRYTFSLSSALYLLNMVPAYYLDGQWATIALIELMVPQWQGARKAAVARAILAAGSGLFVVSILVSLWAAFRSA